MSDQPIGGSHTGAQRSTIARYGSAVAVSAMTNAQLNTYYYFDTSLGAIPGRAASLLNGLKAMLADGRASDWQDYEDRRYILNTLAVAAGLAGSNGD